MEDYTPASPGPTPDQLMPPPNETPRKIITQELINTNPCTQMGKKCKPPLKPTKNGYTKGLKFDLSLEILQNSYVNAIYTRIYTLQMDKIGKLHKTMRYYDESNKELQKRLTGVGVWKLTCSICP